MDMVRHIVMWNFQEQFTPEQNQDNAARVKAGLEDLINHIDGIVSLAVSIHPLSGNRDVVLNSLFVDEAALAGYQEHPKHKEIGKLVRSVLHNRADMDFIED